MQSKPRGIYLGLGHCFPFLCHDLITQPNHSEGKNELSVHSSIHPLYRKNFYQKRVFCLLLFLRLPGDDARRLILFTCKRRLSPAQRYNSRGKFLKRTRTTVKVGQERRFFSVGGTISKRTREIFQLTHAGQHLKARTKSKPPNMVVLLFSRRTCATTMLWLTSTGDSPMANVSCD